MLTRLSGRILHQRPCSRRGGRHEFLFQVGAWPAYCQGLARALTSSSSLMQCWRRRARRVELRCGRGAGPNQPGDVCLWYELRVHRTIVSMDEDGRFAYTPTVNYGGKMVDRCCSAPTGCTTRWAMPITAMLRRSARVTAPIPTSPRRRVWKWLTRSTRLAESGCPGWQLSGGRSAAPAQVRHQD